MNKDYELNPAVTGDYLVFHDLRRASRPPDAALSLGDVAMLVPRPPDAAPRTPEAMRLASWAGERLEDMETRIKAEMKRRDAVESVLKAETDWFAKCASRAEAASDRWHARYRRVCAFSVCAVGGFVWLLAPHVWDAALWLWRLF